MKKIIGALLLAAMLSVTLTGCGLDVPRPEVKKSEFNISVTYELFGEVKTLNGVYACKYTGVDFALDGGSFYRTWKGAFKSGIEGEILDIGTTDDGGVITLTFCLFPEYFMGDPEYADHTPDAWVSVIYYAYRDKYSATYNDIIDDPEIVAGYGARLLSLKCDMPIENSFEPLV